MIYRLLQIGECSYLSDLEPLFWWYLSSVRLSSCSFLQISSHLTKFHDIMWKKSDVISVVEVFEERPHGPLKLYGCHQCQGKIMLLVDLWASSLDSKMLPRCNAWHFRTWYTYIALSFLECSSCIERSTLCWHYWNSNSRNQWRASGVGLQLGTLLYNSRKGGNVVGAEGNIFCIWFTFAFCILQVNIIKMYKKYLSLRTRGSVTGSNFVRFSISSPVKSKVIAITATFFEYKFFWKSISFEFFFLILKILI